MKNKKIDIKYDEEIKIPAKIKEIISYVSFSFSSGLMERKDNEQDLYLLYVKTIRTRPDTLEHEHGWWFIRFKWHLLTKYRKVQKRIDKEWEYKHEMMKDSEEVDDETEKAMERSVFHLKE